MKRQMNWLLVGVLLASFLAGCAAPTPQVIEKEVVVEKEVPVTVEVEKEVVVEKEVAKEVPVEVTRVVEVEKEVEVPAAAGPVTLEVYNPTGAAEVTELHAPRLDTLAGKTICLLSNDSWQAFRVLPLIQELLQKQFPDATFIPHTEFPMGTDGIDNDKTADLAKEKGCQAVIIGDGG